jgi:hypothetical protein
VWELGFERRRGGRRRRLGDGGNGSGSDFWSSRNALRLASIVRFKGLFFEETENVVKNKITVGLLGEEEALNELAPRAALVGHFTDDQDGDATVGGGLSINRMDEDLAVLETQ